MSYYAKPEPAEQPAFGAWGISIAQKWIVGSDCKGEFVPRCEHADAEDAQRCVDELNLIYAGIPRRVSK